MRALTGSLVQLTPLAAADAEALRAIRADPLVAERWDELEPGFPLHDEPESTRLTIHHEGEIAGMIQFGEELEPKYRHASIDIFVAPAHQGRGVGTEAIKLVVDHLLGERDHHRITIDPAADNAAAIALLREGRLRTGRRDAAGGARQRRAWLARLAADGAGRRAGIERGPGPSGVWMSTDSHRPRPELDSRRFVRA